MKRLLALGLGAIMLSGCSQEMLAEDILFEAFENESSKDVSYYIEKTSINSDGEDAIMHEWYDGNGQSKRELYTDGEIQYVDITNEEISSSKDYETETIMHLDYRSEQRDAIGYVSPEQEVQELVRHYSGSFDVDVIGTETILDHETMHVRFEVRPEHDIGMISKIELWFDKSSWVVLKEKIVDGERDFTREAISYEVVDDFPEGTFELDNEEGFYEVNFSDLFSPEPVSLEAAKEQYQSDFLRFNDDFDYDAGFIRPDPDIDDSFVLNLTFTDDRGEITLYIEPEWRLVKEFGLEEQVEVRNQQALMVDEDTLLSFSWQEDGLQYFASFSGDYSREDAEDIISEMIYTNE